MKEQTILGVMSGTSLDGLDFAFCKFKKDKAKYSYKIIKTGFIPYSSEIKKQLKNAQNLSSYDFIKLHKWYGKFIGKNINNFLKEDLKPNFIASHGHTVFHNPKENITFQIGDGAFIASEAKISTISDFRNLDTALKGQGAPLVPIGDKLLFSEYDFCLNLGGFANISFNNENNERIAFDICPVNIVLNELVKPLGKEYDKNGNIGKTGNINFELLKELNNIPFYFKKAPKSLGREYSEKYHLPIIKKYNISQEDKIRTFYKHIAIQITEVLKIKENSKILITGGGTHNTFLISEIQKETKNKLIIPSNEIIDFKEAIIFAFLGFLRINEKENTLKSVTGAIENSIGGSVFIINNKA
ncbi:MAG: anhydro-N-acetylmuramic acid kinase [Chlorobi bacterium]|nr:anhydro-N-acetylmuramic acid kinase [Chlorobiota bacterium]